LIAEGHSSREIGEILNLSQKTVETHRTQLMRKLDFHDLAGLVRYAIRIGLVSSER
jgi:DNA-binding CsgD family transcriptional regulator